MKKMSKEEMEFEVEKRYVLARKKKLIFALLAGGIGGSGIHRMYLGQWWVGALYFLSVFIIPGVSNLIAIIDLLCTSPIVNGVNEVIKVKIRDEVMQVYK